MLSVDVERAGDLTQPLAHARQAAALRRQAAAAVVAHLSVITPSSSAERNRAARRAGMADDVGDGFAQRVGERAYPVRRGIRRDTVISAVMPAAAQRALGVAELVAQPSADSRRRPCALR